MSQIRKKRLIIGSVLFAVAAALIVWWFLPQNPLHGISPQDITMIKVEGLPDVCAEITDEAAIRMITENIISCGAVKEAVSFGRMGYAYRLNFYKGDEYLGAFSLCSEDRARDSLFFYKPKSGTYCQSYFDGLKSKHLE